MTRKNILILDFCLAVLVAILQNLAIIFNLYWVLPWFDILMHFLGGVLIALTSVCVFAIITKQSEEIIISKKFFRNLVFIFVLIVGVLWEVWEFYYGLSFTNSHNGLMDTIGDIFMDLVGAGTVYALFLSQKLKVISFKL